MSSTIEDMFDPAGKQRIVARIHALASTCEPLWGKMSVAQMLAHCNVAYETVHEPGKHARPGPVVRLFLRVFAKGTVVGDKPYPRNVATAPYFVIEGDRDFEEERARLLAYIETTFEQGASHYDGRPSMTFGPLSSKQWNTLFSKHLDHHLRQFGV